MCRVLSLGMGVLGLATTLAGADLSGLVAAEHNGSPVAGAAITLRRGGQVVAETETDDSGLFRATGLPNGEYTVSAVKSSFTTAERNVTLAAAGADVFLQITKLGVISGRVIDHQGAGIRNFVVAAIPVPKDGGPLRVGNQTARPRGASTDASGRYRIFGLPAGDYALVALAGNGRNIAAVTNGVAADTSHGSTAEFFPSNRSPRIFSIRSGEEHSNIDFRGYSGPLFTVRGTVGGPGPDTPYRVSLVSEVGGILLGSATAQPGKEFQFDRVAPGTYRLVTARQSPSGASSLIEAINSGQIVITASNQAAILQELQEAEARVSANAVKADPAFGDTMITVGQDLSGVTIGARTGIDVKLAYEAAEGCPASIQFNLSPIDFTGIATSNKKLQSGEEAAYAGMPPISFSASTNLADATGCYLATQIVDLREVSSGATLPIRVAKLGGLQGSVDIAGHLAEEFTVVLTAPDGFTKQTAALAKDASFAVANLRPGRYRVSLIRRSASRVIAADQDLIVESGATARVNFPALP